MDQKILLGTYTKKNSHGIYQITLNTAEKNLSGLSLIISEDNPTYLAVSDKKTIYTIARDGEKGGGIGAYTYHNGTYQLLNKIVEEGPSPCYVAVDEKRQLVFSANYHKGEIITYQIKDDGAIEFADKVKHTGDGPHENQKGPHTHYADLTPDDRLVACDLGNDQVYTYDVSEDGKLTEYAVYHSEPGAGPRHIVFHPNHQMAYLFCELNSTIEVLAYNNGQFEQIEILSTLPKDYQEANGGAAIRISKDGRFLYASNRGHDSLAVFAVQEEGKHLELIQHISSEGQFPRDFALDATETFIVLANQNSDNLTLYERDPETGLLQVIRKGIYAPEAVCVYIEK